MSNSCIKAKYLQCMLMCFPAESATGELPDTRYLIGQPPAIIPLIVACLDGGGAEGKNTCQSQ